MKLRGPMRDKDAADQRALSPLRFFRLPWLLFWCGALFFSLDLEGMKDHNPARFPLRNKILLKNSL